MTPPGGQSSGRELLVRLVGGVAAANVFLFMLVGASLLQSREQYERQAELMTQNLDQSLEANVSGALDKISIAVAAVAGEAERQFAQGGFRGAELTAYIKQQRSRVPEVDGIRVGDAEGEVRFGADLPPGPATNVSDRDYFRRARANSGESVLCEPVISRQTGHWVLILAHAIHAPDGSFAGAAWAALPLDYFQRLFGAIDVGSRGLMAVRWTDMGLIARAPMIPGTTHSIGTRMVAIETLESLRIHPQSANYRLVTLSDGIERRMAYRRAAHWPLYVFVGAATEDYLATWYAEVATLCSLAALFTLASVLWARSSYRTRLAELKAFGDLQAGKEQLERSETRFRTLYNATSDAVVLLRREGFIDCNPAALKLFGVQGKEQFVAGMPGATFAPPYQPCGTESRVLAERRLNEAYETGSVRFEWVYRRASTGEIFPTEVQYTRVTLDGVALIQAVVRDITDRKKAEEQIRYLAYFDALTKLPNRRLLMDRLARALLASRRTHQYGMLLILDLDNFKGLNDTRGHDVGDHLLIEVAQRISACVRQEDTVARLGGDEYVVMAESLGVDQALAAGQAEQIAEKICRMVSLPSPVPGTGESHHSTASIGVTLFQGETTSIDVLLKQADLALYQAKAAGRNTVRFFNPQMQAAIDSRSAMESALRNGLRNGEFRLHYQPQYNAEGRLTGAEALLRWYRADSAPVSPGEFIPLAEETGLIIPIGFWVMQTACEQLRAWADHPPARKLTIAVNVSPRQFRQADFTDQVRSCIARTGANPTLLKLEMTESVVLDDIDEVIARMQRLRTMGIRFSLDDFGTGFSSLSYLKRLPLDQVKIDQTFVRDVVSDPNDGAIVRAIVAMSRSLALDVIAEGVETPEQLRFLKESGCDHYQGYLFGRPLPIEDWNWDALLGKRLALAQ